MTRFKRGWNSTILLVFAWVLWEHVIDLKNQSEQWIIQPSYPTQQTCIVNGKQIIEDLRLRYLHQIPEGVPYAWEGLGGFYVREKKHIFWCHSSDFDPRPRK